jgi:hypothetical protein
MSSTTPGRGVGLDGFTVTPNWRYKPMDAYIYSADIYCEDCGAAIRAQLTREGKAPADPDNEYSYDSDEYPKGPFMDGGGEADCPQHCGAGAKCLNALELLNGSRIGAFLDNPLTSEGESYVREAVREGGEVAELWADWYDYLDLAETVE